MQPHIQTYMCSNDGTCKVDVNKQEVYGPLEFRPAATKAMKNRHVMIYDLNYLGNHITTNDLEGLEILKFATLFTLVSMCILPPTAM